MNNEPVQMDLTDKKNLINNIYKNIEIPDKLYEEIVINGNNKLKTHLIENILEPEIKKAFGKPTFNFKADDGYNYEIKPLDASTLTSENIANFNKSVNDKLEKVNIDKLIATEEVIKAGKTKLNIFEKIYTIITGKDQEAYLSKKIDRILDKKISNLPSNQSIATKKVLNQPTKGFAQIKKVQAALAKGSTINTSSSIEVPNTPSRSTPKKNEISR